LSNISKAQAANSTAAQKAIDQVTTAVSAHENVVRIINQNGDDVSKQALAKGPPPEPSGPLKGDEILIGVTRRASGLTDPDTESTSTKVRPAVLVTDNKGTRVRAGHEGVASIAVDIIRRYIMPGVNRLRSNSRTSSDGSCSPSRKVSI
jgi:hypothetical protein